MLALTSATPLFDEGRIGMLSDAIGSDELLTMLSDLPSAAAKTLAAITDALPVDEIEHVHRAAHILKGCASTFGAARLAALACEIELELPLFEAMRLPMPALMEALALTAASLAQIASDRIAEECHQ